MRERRVQTVPIGGGVPAAACAEALRTGGDEDEIVLVRGSPDDGAFSIWCLEQGRLGGALSVKRPGDLRKARQLIRTGDLPDERALGDTSAELAGGEG